MKPVSLRSAARRIFWLVPLVLVLVAAPATAKSDATLAAAGTLRFVGKVGAALPYRQGVAVVHIGCAGARTARCVGTVRLLPRGEHTRGLVGSATLARRTVSLKARFRGAVRIKLGARARSAAGRGALLVTVELRSRARRSP